MKRAVFSFVFLFLLWFPGANAQSVRHVLTDFDYIGRWANDCSRPLSPENNFLDVVVTSSDTVEHRYDFGDGRGEVNTIISAQRTGKDELTMRYVRGDSPLERTQVVVRKGDTIRTMRLTLSDGTVVTDDGIIVRVKAPTRTLVRCRR